MADTMHHRRPITLVILSRRHLHSKIHDMATAVEHLLKRTTLPTLLQAQTLLSSWFLLQVSRGHHNKPLNPRHLRTPTQRLLVEYL